MTIVVEQNATGAESHTHAKFFAGTGQVAVDVAGLLGAAGRARYPNGQTQGFAGKEGGGQWFGGMGSQEGFVVEAGVGLFYPDACFESLVDMVLLPFFHSFCLLVP